MGWWCVKANTIKTTPQPGNVSQLELAALPPCGNVSCDVTVLSAWTTTCESVSKVGAAATEACRTYSREAAVCVWGGGSGNTVGSGLAPPQRRSPLLWRLPACAFGRSVPLRMRCMLALPVAPDAFHK